MPFKEHPYYDASDRDDWLADEHAAWFGTLGQALRDQKQSLCALALERIRRHAGEDYLAETPFPALSEFLFHPISDHGFRVYVEYSFSQEPEEPSPDFWWAIVNCAYAIPPYPTGKREYYVIGLGWYVA